MNGQWTQIDKITKWTPTRLDLAQDPGLGLKSSHLLYKKPTNLQWYTSLEHWKKKEDSYSMDETQHRLQGMLTFIVASSEAETITLKTGWKITLVTGLLCPLNAYFSGGRGIHSLGSRFWPSGPPDVNSSLASFSLDSNSITWVFQGGTNKEGIKPALKTQRTNQASVIIKICRFLEWDNAVLQGQLGLLKKSKQICNLHPKISCYGINSVLFILLTWNKMFQINQKQVYWKSINHQLFKNCPLALFFCIIFILDH